MKNNKIYLILFITTLFISCNSSGIKKTKMSEQEILKELDLAFQEKTGSYFPAEMGNVTNYNFFLDLEDGYLAIANSRIHIFADSTHWAIVFEEFGYNSRAFRANIKLYYIGNCIRYIKRDYTTSINISNMELVSLINSVEFERIQNKSGTEMEQFELIDKSTKQVKVRDSFVPFNSNSDDYLEYGIASRQFNNSKNLIGFEGFLRYLAASKNELILAKDSEIKKHLIKDLPEIMTIDNFHYISKDDGVLPSQQELFKMIAKIIMTKDTSYWKPTLKANNHWSNWESGDL